MSKIRNSLGVLVLPVPDDEYSWEEYKEKYGIDLEKIFFVHLDGSDYYVEIKKDFRKLIALSYQGSYDLPVPPVSAPTNYYQSGSETISNSVLGLNVLHGDGDGGYALTVIANKTIRGGEI